MSRIKQLESMIETDPSDPFLPYALALEHAKAEDHEAAVGAFDKCLDIDASYAYAYFHKAKSLAALNRSEEAVSVLESGLREAQHANDSKAASEISELLAEMKS
jgi:tetratricopeptide (TPR) repeat protein